MIHLTTNLDYLNQGQIAPVCHGKICGTFNARRHFYSTRPASSSDLNREPLPERGRHEATEQV
jgi:hypothetical protein